jgi:phosphatidylserine/phosphatidylglycerophosphate/cardiolipin synthase-like enzyme
MWTWSSLIPQKGKSTFAAYVLTDWPVMQALARAADRGVKIRIYLDSTQLAEHEQTKVFQDLAQTPGVEIRTKHNRAPMHLKSYEIDGRVLRTDTARQDCEKAFKRAIY